MDSDEDFVSTMSSEDDVMQDDTDDEISGGDGMLALSVFFYPCCYCPRALETGTQYPG